MPTVGPGRRVSTIGHGTLTPEAFLAVLHANSITLVADVRRFPGSTRMPWTNADALAEFLAGQGIGYVHLPALGGRRAPLPDSPNGGWHNRSFQGYADHMRSAEFASGLAELMEMAQARPTAMLCAETLWWRCHRALIADRLKAMGWEVEHLRPGQREAHRYTAPARVVQGRLSYPP